MSDPIEYQRKLAEAIHDDSIVRFGVGYSKEMLDAIITVLAAKGVVDPDDFNNPTAEAIYRRGMEQAAKIAETFTAECNNIWVGSEGCPLDHSGYECRKHTDVAAAIRANIKQESVSK